MQKLNRVGSYNEYADDIVTPAARSYIEDANGSARGNAGTLKPIAISVGGAVKQPNYGSLRDRSFISLASNQTLCFVVPFAASGDVHESVRSGELRLMADCGGFCHVSGSSANSAVHVRPVLLSVASGSGLIDSYAQADGNTLGTADWRYLRPGTFQIADVGEGATASVHRTYDFKETFLWDYANDVHLLTANPAGRVFAFGVVISTSHANINVTLRDLYLYFRLYTEDYQLFHGG